MIRPRSRRPAARVTASVFYRVLFAVVALGLSACDAAETAAPDVGADVVSPPDTVTDTVAVTDAAAGTDTAAITDTTTGTDTATGTDTGTDAGTDAGTDTVDPSLDIDWGGPDVTPWEPPALAPTVVRWAPAERPVQLPFPSDHYLVTDETSRTGQRVLMDGEANSNAMIDPIFRILAIYRDALNSLEGFGAYGYAAVELAGNPPEDWRQEPAEGLPPGTPVRMWSWDGASLGDEIPFRARIVSAKERNGTPHHYLDVLPLRPLPDRARYVVAITRDFLDADGVPIGPDADFLMALELHRYPPDEARAQAVSQRAGELFPVLQALEADAGLTREELAVAFSVTVAPVREALHAVAARFQEDEELRTVAATFDLDEDGADDIYLPGEAGFMGGIGQCAVFARGRLERRNYRHADHFDGAFRLDEDGLPIPAGREPLSFYLTLPPGGGPFPTVLLLHGIESKKEDVRRLADMLCGEGYAILAIDLPKHGDDGGGAADFLDIPHPLAGRDNWRQAAIDIQTARWLLVTWQNAGLDLAPGRVGDGVPDLDASRVVLIGHSLGAMTGSMAMAIGQQPEAGVLTVGGGGLMYFIRNFLDTYGFSAALEGHLIHSVEVLGGHIWSAGDPVVYAEWIRHDPLAWVERPHQAILLEALGDETMPEACLEAHAAAMRLPHVGPVLKPVAGVPPTDDIAPSAGLVQYDGSAHSLMLSAPRSDEARAQAVHFLNTFRDTGTAEIIHPWTAP